ncbi:uncharacterized protein MONOS_14883 [Monocercomonoides exilis]|uniref:uncharacterized protein n=1 Tax=Monocercomonoides exilis TaxID=2049356 RepID=UPI003559FED4|nr:hypothetical protein MONOS_14883 [Monocercomonoides exilis]|eukprot:MONOS_14883.1-p1 / transcript=MONOS_14883.1 / gene=MONOS_14883 / organism=Monocercomonoides_exilis_PA203 / gene_product=unspecified product / transcript_product=unspecified product / location=Mono_scaffold01096:4864-13785(-) / protein_length=2882 / sequence_SO=supercontig / SO=protein_coding / is_pseudo=false
MDPYQIVASTGSATVNCGLSTSTACKSVNTAIVNRRASYLKRIKLLNGTYNEKDSWVITSARGKVDAFGEDQAKVILNLNEYNGSSMIFISGAVNATISTFTINVNKNSIQIISGTSGNFNFTMTDIIILTPSGWSADFTKSLFYFTSGTIAFNGVNGGAICLKTDQCQVRFTNTSFTNCRVSQSRGRGGALYFSTNGSLSKFTISRCQFSLNQAYFGRDVFMCVPSLPNANLDSYYSAAATSTYVPNRTNAWFGRDNATFEGDFDLMPFIFGYTSSIIHASNASRGDGKYCGSTVAHCRSITQAVQRFNGSSRTIKANGTVEVATSGTDVSNVVVERNESTVNATVTIDRIAGTANSALMSSGAFISQNIAYSIGSVPQGSSVQNFLSGTGGTQTFSNCIFNGDVSNALTIALVSISGGSLVLENSSLTAPSELTCTRSLFTLQNGIFKFSDSRFANLKFSSDEASLISPTDSETSSQQIEISNCSFEQVSSTKAVSSCVAVSSSTCRGSFNASSCNFTSSTCTNSVNGGAISFAVGLNKKFEINQCKISFNTASELAGKGGGVFLLLKDISSDYKITGCSFESNKAKYGRDIYIQAPNLNSCVTFEKFGNLLTPTTDIENMMYGCNSSSVDQHVNLISLMSMRLAIVSVKNADSDYGNDWFRCGNESYPCLTVEYGIDKILDSTAENKELSIITQAVISKPVDLSSISILSSSSSALSILSFNFASTTFDAAIINHDILTFNKIKLYLPSVRNVLKALISTDSSLIVNDSNFDSELLNSSVYLNTIEVKGGTVLLYNCSIGERSFCLESSFIKYADSSTITLNHTSISTLTLSSTFFSEIAGGQGILSLINTSFTRCSAPQQKMISSIISSQLEGSVNIEECNFSCVGSSGCKEGGVINVWLKDTGKISISGCQVGECFCNEATGKGGFLYLSKQQSEGQYDLSSESKYSNNKARIGKNLFFDFDSLNASVSADKLFLPVNDPAVDGGKAYIGKDAIFDSVDLIVFLVQFVSEKIHVSNAGYDILRISKEIIFDTLVEVESYYEFQNLTLSAASSSQGTGMTICSDLPSSDKDTAISIAGNTNFVNITFSLPSEFVGRQSSVIKCAASEGVLQLSSCGFSKQSNFLTPISYSLVSAINGKLLVHDCTVENLLFSASPFVILQSVNATFDQSHFLSVMLQMISLLTAAEVSAQSAQSNNDATSEFVFTNCSFDRIVAKEGTSKSVIITDPLSSSLSLINCSVTSLTASESNEGGGMKIKFKAGGSLSVKGDAVSGTSVVSSCSCSPASGKGGFCFVDSIGADADFVFEKIKFSDNVASMGKNVFFSCADLSSSVKPEQFLINLDEWITDTNAFSGTDTAYFTAKAVDLLAFIVDYNSERIIVSSSFGADVKGCGKETLPCSSFSTGLQHIINTTEFDQPVTQILIENSAIIESCFDVSEREIGSLYNTPAELSIATSLSSLPSSVTSENYIFLNNKTLKLTLLRFIIPTNFTTSQSILILSSSGTLLMKNCSMTTNANLNEAISYCLVEVRSGEFEIEDFSLKGLSFGSNPMRFGATDINGKMENCLFEELILQSPLFFIPETHISLSGREHIAHSSFSTLTNGDCVLELMSCRMNDITRDDDGSCLLSCETINNVKFKMSGCILNGCESKTSTKGGSMMFTIGPGNSDTIMFDINGTSLGKCVASTAIGKGGGVYLDCSSILAAGGNGRLSNDNPLGFRFKNARFSFNNASSGRDVFIVCVNIVSQVTEDQFLIDFDESVFDSRNAIFGREVSMAASERDRDLIDEIRYFRGEQVLVSSNGENGNRCGNFTGPCKTIDEVVHHVSEGRRRTIFIDEQASIEREMDLSEISMVPLDELCTVFMNSTIEKSAERNFAITTKENVQIDNVAYIFGSSLKITHSSLIGVLEGRLRMNTCSFIGRDNNVQFDGSLIAVVGGTMKITESTVCSLTVANYIIGCERGTTTNMDRVHLEGLRGNCLISCVGNTLAASQLTVSSSKATKAVVSCSGNATINLLQAELKDVDVEEGSAIYVENGETLITDNSETEIEKAFLASLCVFANVSCGGNEGRVLTSLTEKSVQLINNTFSLCSCLSTKGKQISTFNSKSVAIDACVFDGLEEISRDVANSDATDEICKWNGSLIDITNSNATVKETSIVNSSVGGMTVFGSIITIEKGEFLNNNKLILAYQSARRNILCSEESVLNIVSLKGGDGFKDNSSLWILQDKCTLEGVAADQPSPFFIPTLESVKVADLGTDTKLTLKGNLLMPCNLFVRLIYKTNEEYVYEKREIDSNGWISENEAISTIKSTDISSAAKQTELSVALLFGNPDLPSSTSSKVIKNITKEEETNPIAKVTNEVTPSWALIALIIVAVLFFIAALGIIVIVIRWRKEKRHSNQLEVMVEQTAKKDPKEIEMMTYGFGTGEEPNIQRERTSGLGKQRVQKRKLAASESQQSLLAEVGSTQEILLDDSDEIPEWALEKAEGENDDGEDFIKDGIDANYKATLSTEMKEESSLTTMLTLEQMAPTTSSMSNLVDGMACESPHEKMIVDLRDSLFMLLHGKNDKKEMAIGTLEQREITAAQVLFWVTNGALHSLEQEQAISPCLESLSPHIVLFSEHMMVVIAINSGFSSEDSDDSSSMDSSSTNSSSAMSDCRNSQRSGDREKQKKNKLSSFEEETIDNESLRWKAPELQWIEKRDATNKSVSFTIGMMLWECLTLQIPFAKYDAETAGTKIKNGERVDYDLLSSSSFEDIVKSCLSSNTEERLSLASLKREFIQHFPPGAVQLSISDAIDIEEVSDYCRGGDLITRTGSTQSDSYEGSGEYSLETFDTATSTKTSAAATSTQNSSAVSDIQLVPYEQSENLTLSEAKKFGDEELSSSIVP